MLVSFSYQAVTDSWYDSRRSRAIKLDERYGHEGCFSIDWAIRLYRGRSIQAY
jgi:hypothetical protein